jgi:hypothetical protein
MREFAKGKGAPLRERAQGILDRVGGPVHTGRGRNQNRSKEQRPTTPSKEEKVVAATTGHAEPGGEQWK